MDKKFKYILIIMLVLLVSGFIGLLLSNKFNSSDEIANDDVRVSGSIKSSDTDIRLKHHSWGYLEYTIQNKDQVAHDVRIVLTPINQKNIIIYEKTVHIEPQSVLVDRAMITTGTVDEYILNHYIDGKKHISELLEEKKLSIVLNDDAVKKIVFVNDDFISTGLLHDPMNNKNKIKNKSKNKSKNKNKNRRNLQGLRLNPMPRHLRGRILQGE